MLEMRTSCDTSINSDDSLQENSSDIMDIIRGIDSKTDPSKSFAAEKRLNNAILHKCITVKAKGEELTGFVVEVMIEFGNVIIDFAGGYTVKTSADQINDIKFTTQIEVENYFRELRSSNHQAFSFEPVRKRIERTLKN